VIATIGLHGSASTWVFNVVRELMAAALGEDSVVGLFADDAAGLLAEHTLQGRHVVLKSHCGGRGWDSLVWLTRAPLILSIRDPRDAAISLAQRFGMPLTNAVRGIAQDCRHVVRCAEAGHAVLRYEDRFFEDEALPGRLAGQLGLAVGAEAQAVIFSRYSTAATRSFAARIGDLPADRIVLAGGTTYDRLTQIHRTHIGDGQVGKWQDLLDARNAMEITRYFAPFLARFGYAQ